MFQIRTSYGSVVNPKRNVYNDKWENVGRYNVPYSKNRGNELSPCDLPMLRG